MCWHTAVEGFWHGFDVHLLLPLHMGELLWCQKHRNQFAGLSGYRHEKVVEHYVIRVLLHNVEGRFDMQQPFSVDRFTQ